MKAGARVIALIAAGDRAGATREALHEVGPRVRRYLLQVLRDQTAADEAFARFTESVWEGLASYRGEAPLGTWALRIATNSARDQQRDAWRQRACTLRPEHDLPNHEQSTPGRRDREQEVFEQLRAELSPEDQALLVLRLDQRLSWADAAAVLSSDAEPIGPDALRKRYERLRARLAELVRAKGLME